MWLSLQYQWAFVVDPIAFYTSLFDPDYSRRPHPSLINVILLIATCHPGVPPATRAKSESLLARALVAVQLGISQADRLLDVIHASCLLSTYFYTQNRVQEGYYHSTAAARLMITLQSHLPDYSSCGGSYGADSRISILAHVFAVDRSWSVVTGLPPALRDEDCFVPSMVESLTGFSADPSVRFSADSWHAMPLNFIHRSCVTLRISAFVIPKTYYRQIGFLMPSPSG